MNSKQIIQPVLFLVAIFFASKSLGQYKRQPVQLETRWAKEVSPNHTQDGYPRPQLERKQWKTLNGLWDYAIVPKDAEVKGYQGKILVPYPVESSLSGVKRSLLPNENLWYRRNFTSEPKKGERQLLHFGAVDYQAYIYINGKLAGEHTGGYTTFTLDITDFVKTGTNELKVKVYDPTDQGIGPHGKQVLNPANIYYTPSSGIWQTVWLEKVSETYVEQLETTPDIDKQSLKIKLHLHKSNGPISIEALATNGTKQIAHLRQNANLNDFETTLSIKKPDLWSPETPHLYGLTIRIIQDGKIRDQVKSYFGMRKIGIAKDSHGFARICLNNKPYYNLGTLDQGFWPDGLYTAPTDEALKFDIQAAKAMGFNTIRKHIKVEPARWYYYADKLGMLVWQDMVNPNQGLPEGSKLEFEKESKEIIQQLHNYPSITTWVLFNERWGAYDQERLTNWVKQLDPRRLVNGHTGEYLYVNDQLRQPSKEPYVGSDMTDVHSYPNPMLPMNLKGKVMVCGEFGGIGAAVPNHEWNDLKGWGYVEVPTSELLGKYRVMTKRLLDLKANGLSASIYTQPFDVEGEENGLITYDRQLIKIPLRKLYEINKSVCDNIENTIPTITIGDVDLNDNDSRYPKLQAEYNHGKRDSAFLRRLTLMALRKQDQDNATVYGNELIAQLKNVYTLENLNFIDQITRTSQDKGFDIFRTTPQLVDSKLGTFTAESKVGVIIFKEEIEPFLKTSKPDWNTIEANIKSKYGLIGLEKYYGQRMLFALEGQDWQTYGKYYAMYFKTAESHSEYHINNTSWTVFEHITDPEVLNVAISAMRYSVDHFAPNDPGEIDTYSNLLYKAGRTEEAIEWENKAVRLSKGDKTFVDTLEKMKKGEPTWPQK